MKKDKNPPKLLTKVVYPGGEKAMSRFVQTHLNYPSEAMENEIEGDVLIKYRVGSHGKVLDAKVEKGIGSGCDEEALRLVKLLKFNSQVNKKIKSYHNMSVTIHFRLPVAKKKKSKQGPSKKTVESKTGKNKVSASNVDHSFQTPKVLYHFVPKVVKKKQDAPMKPKKKEPKTYTYTIKRN